MELLGDGHAFQSWGLERRSEVTGLGDTEGTMGTILSLSPMCMYMCIYTGTYMLICVQCTGVCVPVHRKVRGQPQLFFFFFRSHPLVFWDGVSHWPETHQAELAGRLQSTRIPQSPPPHYLVTREFDHMQLFLVGSGAWTQIFTSMP